jgi:signal transduction histidine kinase
MAVGGIAQMALSIAFAAVLAPARVGEGQDELALLTAGAGSLVTVLVGLATWFARRRAGIESLTRTLPLAPRVASPLAAGIAVLALVPPEVRSSEPLRMLLPIVGSTWAAGLFAASWLEPALLAIAVAAADGTPTTSPSAPASRPSLASSYGGVLGSAALGSAAFALVAVFTYGVPASSDATPRMVTVLASIFTVTVLAFAAGVSIGASPGSALRSMAARIDALGRPRDVEERRPRPALTEPIRATSADDLGALLIELERLRARMADDVSAYREALERTQRADEQKAGFLAAVSHELRTPLNSIGGFAQLLLEGHPRPLTEPQAEDVRLIMAGGQQLLGLIDDILDMAMIESGELSLVFTTADVRALLEEVVDIHRPLVHDREIELVLDAPDSLPLARCDRRRIGQVLNNLVSNAIKFTEKGTIAVRARVEGEALVLDVADTGVGIAPADVPAIFDAYKQVGSLKRRAKGTGLGLAIARSIATHHGGTLKATSELGAGSVFTMTLPIEPAHMPASIDVAAEAARAASRHGGARPDEAASPLAAPSIVPAGVPAVVPGGVPAGVPDSTPEGTA